MRHTQYTNAQYQTSTRKGNLNNSRLKNRSSKTFVSGVHTFFDPKQKSRLRQLLCTYSVEAVSPRRLSASPDGLLAPDSSPFGESSRLPLWYGLLVNGVGEEVRFSHVPSNSRDNTTKGSMKAPTPMPFELKSVVPTKCWQLITMR